MTLAGCARRRKSAGTSALGLVAMAIDVARLRQLQPFESSGFCEGLDASQCSGVVVAGISGANVELKFSALQEKFSELQGDVDRDQNHWN